MAVMFDLILQADVLLSKTCVRSFLHACATTACGVHIIFTSLQEVLCFPAKQLSDVLTTTTAASEINRRM